MLTVFNLILICTIAFPIDWPLITPSYLNQFIYFLYYLFKYYSLVGIIIIF